MPLRERAGAVPLLAHALLERALRRLPLPPPRLSEGALAALCAHDWPGNVRELENTIERLAIRCAGCDVLERDVARALGDGEAQHSGEH